MLAKSHFYFHKAVGANIIGMYHAQVLQQRWILDRTGEEGHVVKTTVKISTILAALILVWYLVAEGLRLTRRDQ